VRHELAVVFREPEPAATLARLDTLGVLAATHAALHWTDAETADAQVVVSGPPPAWQWSAGWPVDSIYLTLLLRRAAPAEAGQALARLGVSRAVHDAVMGALGLQLSGTRPSEVVAQLDALSLDGVVAAYAAQPAARERLDAYLARWRFMRPKLTGDDLLAMGLPPGPSYRQILGRLRAARLDGEIDEAGELALVQMLAGRE
jgi:tRNA nucleotidyltransferase (CCA-adding enzyme)